MNTLSTIVIILNVLVLLTMPIIPMVIQWHLDPVVKAAYSFPWRTGQIDSAARAYHQHLVNHALMSLSGIVLAFRGGWIYWLGLAVFILGKAYPFFKEFYWDPKVLKKAKNYLDWRERLAGDLCTLPLFVIASLEFFI